MVQVQCTNGRHSVPVELNDVSGAQLVQMQQEVADKLGSLGNQDAIQQSFEALVTIAPRANPSDLWRHVLMQQYIASGRSDNSWKKASGLAFEHAYVSLYNPRLIGSGVRLQVLTPVSARRARDYIAQVAESSGVTEAVVILMRTTPPSKLDVAIEGQCADGSWRLFGIVHAKTSLAERVNDDAPASRAVIECGFYSPLVTLDNKCFPPPHGDGVNYGELGGRTGIGTRPQQKRDYVEVDGTFSNAYSYNLRTPPSGPATSSGCRIKTLRFGDPDDLFTQDLVARWARERDRLCRVEPTPLG